jgi:hypothetical protein
LWANGADAGLVAVMIDLLAHGLGGEPVGQHPVEDAE